MFDNKYPYTDFHELNLDWFMGEFKKLVAEWEETKGEWNTLHDYVQNYFNNLNVQTEIDNKINAMILDGSFADIVSPFVTAALPALVAGQLPDVVAAQISAVVAAQISAVVADQLPAVAAAAAAQEVGTWLAAHIDPDTGYVIDDTLTVSQAAADAKTVGDWINMLFSIYNPQHDAWSYGSFTSADGATTPSNIRIRTDNYIEYSKGARYIQCTSAFQFMVYVWNSSNVYQGILKTDGTISANISDIVRLRELNLESLKNYKIKLTMMNNAGDSSIIPSDGAYTTIYYATDKSLFIANKIADAKATGDMIISEDNYIKRIATEYTTFTLSDIEWITDYYLSINNVPTAAEGYRYSTPIEVKSGDSITYAISSINNISVALAAYDRDLNYIKTESIYYDSGQGSGSLVTFTGTYIVPQNVRYIKICQKISTAGQSVSIPCFISIPLDNEKRIDAIEHDLDTLDLTNQWYNKKWVAFGTSITDNWSEYSYITHGDHAGEHTGKYVPYLLDMSELSSDAFVNRGIAGGSINGHILYYLRYYTSDMSDADLITIEGSINDFAGSVPLGEVGDTVPYTNELLPDSTASGTFAGACYQAFTTAITNAPNAVIVFLTDATGKGDGYENYSQTRTNSLGLYQIDYINMAISVAKFVGIPVIECGSRSMINAQNPDYIADHIHHTYLGGYQYAKTIWADLKNIPLKALSIPL